MLNSTSDVYLQALAEAKTEYARLAAEINRMNKRQSQLEAFIANVEPLISLGDSSREPSPLQPSQTFLTGARVPPPPIWKSIVHSINGKCKGFTVKDAIDGMERIGRTIDSPNRSQIVRNVLINKKDTFLQVNAGLFALKEGCEEKEVASEEGTS